MLMFLMFNGPLHLAYDGVFDWSRDLSTCADVALLLALLFVARRRPSAIRPVAFTAACVVAGLVGCSLGAAGVALGSASLAVAGLLAACASDVWGVVVWILALSTLERRPCLVCLALSGALATPLAYSINEWAPYAAINALNACFTAALPLLCLPLTRPFFARLATAGVPREREITHPQAFLPFGHAFYVYIFVKYHVRNVYAKLGVHSQQELVDEVAGQ